MLLAPSGLIQVMILNILYMHIHAKKSITTLLTIWTNILSTLRLKEPEK